MSKRKAPDRRELRTEAARSPNFPPSLNKTRGWSQSQFEEENLRRRLEQVIGRTPLQPGALSKIPNLARALCDTFLWEKSATAVKRKTRQASANSVKRQLHEIEKGSKTLLKRLTRTPANVFEAWAEAADAEYTDRHEATQEWLQLKRLLEDSAERARQAAEAVMPKTSAAENRGRPPDDIAAAITIEAAKAYEELTGRGAVRSIDRVTGRPYGEFHDFLTAVFETLGINSSPDASNMRLQTDLRNLPGPGKKR